MIDQLLNETVSVSRATIGATGTQGGFSQTFQDKGSIRCRIRPASVNERFLAGGRGEAVHLFVGYVKPKTSVVRGDVWARSDGTSLAVLFVRDPSRAHHREVDLEQMEGAEVV